MSREIVKSAICGCMVKRENVLASLGATVEPVRIPTFYECLLHSPQLHGFTVEYQAWVRFLFEALYA